MTTDSEIVLSGTTGCFAVANVAGGTLNLAESGDNAAPNWTHVVAVGTYPLDPG